MIPTFRLLMRHERGLESCQVIIVTPTFEKMIWPRQNGWSNWHKTWFATYTLTTEYRQTSFPNMEEKWISPNTVLIHTKVQMHNLYSKCVHSVRGGNWHNGQSVKLMCKIVGNRNTNWSKYDHDILIGLYLRTSNIYVLHMQEICSTPYVWRSLR